MRLLHLHLPNPIEYAHSLRLQDAILEQQFTQTRYFLNRGSKTARGAVAAAATETQPQPPTPTLLTFQSQPTYTVGRRHLKSNPLSTAQISYLTSSRSLTDFERTGNHQNETRNRDLATFYTSPRGGLLTYHAPGQLTAYLIYNLRYHGITPRCHVRLLEHAIIRTCARHGVPNTLTTDDPGVWIGQRTNTTASDHENHNPTTSVKMGANDMTVTNRKICAIGVHVTRGVTSHGIGLNVFDSPVPKSHADLYRLPAMPTFSNSAAGDLEGFSSASVSSNTNSTNVVESLGLPDNGLPAPGYLSWGFSRIVACGLEGKSVTWLAKERVDNQKSSFADIQEVAATLAEEIAIGLTAAGTIHIKSVEPLSEEDIIS